MENKSPQNKSQFIAEKGKNPLSFVLFRAPHFCILLACQIAHTAHYFFKKFSRLLVIGNLKKVKSCSHR